MFKICGINHSAKNVCCTPEVIFKFFFRHSETPFSFFVNSLPVVFLSRVDRFLPMLQVEVCFLCFRLVSRRCHIISTIHLLAPAPHRTGLADFPHPALQTGSQVSSLIVDSVLLTILWPVLCPAIVSPPPYTCLSTPSLFRHYPASSVLWVDPTTYAPSPHLVSSVSGTPLL